MVLTILCWNSSLSSAAVLWRQAIWKVSTAVTIRFSEQPGFRALGHGLNHPAILQFHAVGRRGLLEAAVAPLPGETILTLNEAILAACQQDREALCRQIQRYYLAYTEVEYP